MLLLLLIQKKLTIFSFWLSYNNFTANQNGELVTYIIHYTRMSMMWLTFHKVFYSLDQQQITGSNIFWTTSVHAEALKNNPNNCQRLKSVRTHNSGTFHIIIHYLQSKRVRKLYSLQTCIIVGRCEKSNLMHKNTLRGLVKMLGLEMTTKSIRARSHAFEQLEKFPHLRSNVKLWVPRLASSALGSTASHAQHYYLQLNPDDTSALKQNTQYILRHI